MWGRHRKYQGVVFSSPKLVIVEGIEIIKKKKILGGKLNKERYSEESGTNFRRLPCLWEASSGSYWIRVLIETLGQRRALVSVSFI